MQQSLVYKLVKGVLLGDAFGAGWEMKSREYMLKNIDKLKSQLVDRDPGFNQDYLPGDPTDDTEMTIGTYRAILKNTVPTREDFIKNWYEVHQELIKLNGHPTIGHGNFINYCKNPTPETVEKMCVKQSKKPQTSGNAPVMRCSPLILLEDPMEAAMLSALATHPSPYAALSTVLLVWAGKYYLEHESQDKLVETLLQQLKDNESRLKEILNSDKYVEKASIQPAFDDLVREMKMVDALPEPKDPLGADINYRALVGDEPSEILGSETGLNGGSFRTFICALFCLRWADKVTLWENLLRVVLFGGDVDTLAACVMPFVYAKSTTKDDLPKWVVDAINWKNLTLLE